MHLHLSSPSLLLSFLFLFHFAFLVNTNISLAPMAIFTTKTKLGYYYCNLIAEADLHNPRVDKSYEGDDDDDDDGVDVAPAA